jgi:outer membrane protein assembly factor BamB
MKKHHFLLLFLCAALFLGGCDKKDKTPLEGQREFVLLNAEILKPDESMKGHEISLPAPVLNAEWSQPSGNASHAMRPVELENTLSKVWDVSIGSGSGTERRLLNGPVAGEGKVFSVDAEGLVSAFSLKDGERVWEADTKPEDGAYQPFGGGIAYNAGKLFVTTSGAQVLCLDAKSGKVLWKNSVSAPVRSSPTVHEGKVYAVTINNQLDVFEEETGKILWSHNGIMESAGLLGGASVAAQGGVAIIPYSSGEVFALRAENGYPLWSETLASYHRLDSVSSLAHIKARPVIDKGMVILISHGGKISALDLRNGQNIWHKEVSGIRSPAVAGGYIFFLTADNDLVCLTQDKGLVVWAKQLPKYEGDETKAEKVLWAGPVLAGDRVVVSGSNGEARFFSVKDGSEVGKLPLPSRTTLSPIIVEKTLIFLTDNAELVAFR